MHAQIWLKILSKNTNELKYMAEMAYLESTFSINQQHIEITYSGFSDSLPNLVKKITLILSTFNPVQNKALFDSVLTEITRN
jgi:secreted Zn-dependent insulinase-like peptidase